MLLSLDQVEEVEVSNTITAANDDYDEEEDGGEDSRGPIMEQMEH